MKQVIFNVGGALSSYIELCNKRVVVDLGKSDDFNPVTDFLVPLLNKKRVAKAKYLIDQCIISHPHNDHISAIEDFNKYFNPVLLTCPNSNKEMSDNKKINWDRFKDSDGKLSNNILVLKEMLEGRSPPLQEVCDKSKIFYLPPKDVENNNALCNESYPNNISIVAYFNINGYSVLMPGDVQKEGMREIIQQDTRFHNTLKDGIDVLVAPHHGLESSFSTDLFRTLKGKKTRCINIVSEKATPANSDDGRVVDTRYSSSEYCSGENSLSKKDEPCYQIKTSRGHIFIDYSDREKLHIEIINDVQELLEKF